VPQETSTIGSMRQTGVVSVDNPTILESDRGTGRFGGAGEAVRSGGTDDGRILTIIHGVKDSLVPVRMGRRLADQASEGVSAFRVNMVELAGADHNDVIDESKWPVRNAFFKAMFGSPDK